MIVEAYKQDNGYFIPISGKNKSIKVYLEEDVEGLDVLSFLKNATQDHNHKEITKDEFREMYGDELYRKYLLLDKQTMDDNWEYLVRTKFDHGDDFEEMEEAVSNWSKE